MSILGVLYRNGAARGAVALAPLIAIALYAAYEFRPLRLGLELLLLGVAPPIALGMSLAKLSTRALSYGHATARLPKAPDVPDHEEAA